MKSITLLQPRHSYAPSPDKKILGDNSLPNSLLNVQARLIDAGVNTILLDHNVTPDRQPETDVVGITVLGMPYIPIVRKKVDELLRQGKQVILGGQIIDGLVHKHDGIVTDRSQLDVFFGRDAIYGNDDAKLSELLDIDAGSLPMWTRTSLIDAYERLDETSLRHYMSGHIPFELGQGCKEKCTFCAIRDKGAKERYRDNDVIERDLQWLAMKAEELGIQTLQFYLTNVDLLQTPERLRQFAETATRIGQEVKDVRLRFRGLCTVQEYLNVHDHYPDVMEALVAAGLERMGAGVDGWSYEYWKSRAKKHNDETKCIRFVEEAPKDGIKPEILMVYGGETEGQQSKKMMQQANDFLQWAVENHDAVPRPHYEKLLIPGNVDWAKAVRKDDYRIKMLHARPEFCQANDFCAGPSSMTDPDPVERHAKKELFLKAIQMKNTLTKYVEPQDWECSEKENKRRATANIGNYDL